jgi:nitrogen regulatory protein PII
MKEIKAYVKPHKMPHVALALHRINGLTGMSVTEIKGFGRSRIGDGREEILIDTVEYNTQAKIEIVCHDELVEEVISAIQGSAHTGLRGDGNIYVNSIEDAIRISTGERGEKAV